MKAMACLQFLFLLSTCPVLALEVAQRRGLLQNSPSGEDNQECSLSAARDSNATLPVDFAFGFNLDVSSAKKPTEKEAEELKSAIKNFKTVQAEMQEAQSRLLNAMTAM